MKHRKLMPRITCLHEECGRAMYFLHSTNTQMVYGCTRGHIRKIDRPDGQRIPVNGTRPPAA